ncbi:hypothetical protein NRIC_34550 [Enterococcus florum]|uniref:Uncharacterized protein n=1 Tax=Enterococcus florum TaxID=2480627 RepID=A0A4P5PFM5_9ENTE|nr:hypothetical protein [Enterococcus florum]GCF95564.1 hypothetical protein NRIC_34550 [Enterococcus florum]
MIKKEKDAAKHSVKVSDLLLETTALLILISLTIYAVKTGKLF